MATTTNFGWETPDDTDLVKDGALAIRTLGSAIDTSLVDLKGGTSGQILAKNSNSDMDFVWIANDQGDITEVNAGTGISGGGTSGSVTITNTVATTFDAAGDLLVGTGSDTWKRLGIGTAGQVLKVNSGATDLEWGAGASTSFVGASAYNSGTQSIANAAWTAINFDSEYFDTDAYHSTSTNTGRLTIPSGKGGKYLLSAQVIFSGNATGYRGLRFLKNGSETGAYTYDIRPAVNGDGTGIHIQGIYNLVATDYMTVQVYQSSGGNLNIEQQNYNAFSIVYLGA